MSDTRLLIRLAEDDDDFILGLVPRFVDFPLPPWRKRHECIEGIRTDLLRRENLDEIIAFIEKFGGLTASAAAE